MNGGSRRIVTISPLMVRRPVRRGGRAEGDDQRYAADHRRAAHHRAEHHDHADGEIDAGGQDQWSRDTERRDDGDC
jgi:hypothetical protein